MQKELKKESEKYSENFYKMIYAVTKLENSALKYSFFFSRGSSPNATHSHFLMGSCHPLRTALQSDTNIISGFRMIYTYQPVLVFVISASVGHLSCPLDFHSTVAKSLVLTSLGKFYTVAHRSVTDPWSGIFVNSSKSSVWVP